MNCSNIDNLLEVKKYYLGFPNSSQKVACRLEGNKQDLKPLIYFCIIYLFIFFYVCILYNTKHKKKSIRF